MTSTLSVVMASEFLIVIEKPNRSSLTCTLYDLTSTTTHHVPKDARDRLPACSIGGGQRPVHGCDEGDCSDPQVLEQGGGLGQLQCGQGVQQGLTAHGHRGVDACQGRRHVQGGCVVGFRHLSKKAWGSGGMVDALCKERWGPPAHSPFRP